MLAPAQLTSALLKHGHTGLCWCIYSFNSDLLSNCYAWEKKGIL